MKNCNVLKINQMDFLIESGEELREQFSEEELNCAWANREEYWRNEIFEKGGDARGSSARPASAAVLLEALSRAN